MQVTDEILKEWNKNLDRGDKQLLVIHTKTSYKTISDAFNGDASEGLIISINQFFAEKKQRVAASFNLIKD